MDVTSYMMGKKAGGSGGTTNYADLSNKPSINDVELSGNKATSDLHISYDDLEDKPTIPIYTAGTNISITNGEISATDTTYTAGTGINISPDNEISASGGSGATYKVLYENTSGGFVSGDINIPNLTTNYKFIDIEYNLRTNGGTGHYVSRIDLSSGQGGSINLVAIWSNGSVFEIGFKQYTVLNDGIRGWANGGRQMLYNTDGWALSTNNTECPIMKVIGYSVTKEQ